MDIGITGSDGVPFQRSAILRMPSKTTDDSNIKHAKLEF
jgi:hypothetical protein